MKVLGVRVPGDWSRALGELRGILWSVVHGYHRSEIFSLVVDSKLDACKSPVQVLHVLRTGSLQPTFLDHWQAIAATNRISQMCRRFRLVWIDALPYILRHKRLPRAQSFPLLVVVPVVFHADELVRTHLVDETLAIVRVEWDCDVVILVAGDDNHFAIFGEDGPEARRGRVLLC